MPDFSFDIATPIPQAPENGVQVFKSPNQPDWRVFVQAGPSGISIRRQLIRTLRQAGATIEIDPKDARVILVEPASREGRILIRNWSGLLDKAVLNYQWVQKSMAAGRPLDERENWGECQALDDGLPIEEEVDGDDCFQLPGPSPARKPPSRKVPKEQVQVATTVDTTPTVPTKSTESQSYPLQSNTSINSQNPPYQAKEQGSVPAQLVPQALAPHSAMMQTMANMFSTTQQASPVQLTQEQQHVMISLLASHQFFGMPFWNQYPLVANGVPPLPSPFAGLSQTPTQPPLSAHSQGSVAAQSSPPSPPESQHIPKPKSKVPPSKRKATASASVQRPGSRSVSAGPSQSPHPQAFLFLSSSGDPLTFFVQINLKDRRNVVGRIQKGGGRIISDHAEADYAILSSQADHFNTLLDQITAAGKRAQNANFVHACFEGNKIVDPSPFTFDAPTTSKKRRTASVKQEDTSPYKSHRKRSPTDSPITSIKTKKPRGAADPPNGSQSMPPTSVLQDDAPMTASPLVVSKPVKRIETNGKGPSKVKTEKKSAPAVHSGERSPTPPPPETRRAGMKGYFFTEEEDQYALRYIKILLNRDPEMTMTGIAKALYSKMEHHTIGSYMTHLGANHKQDIAALRKRASIALRKRENEVRLRTSISMDSPGPSTPESARNADDGFAARLEKDLDTVTNYFAFGGGDPGDGEEERETIWRRLSDQAECQTATSWEDFYTVHNEEVVRRFEALVKQEG